MLCEDTSKTTKHSLFWRITCGLIETVLRHLTVQYVYQNLELGFLWSNRGRPYPQKTQIRTVAATASTPAQWHEASWCCSPLAARWQLAMSLQLTSSPWGSCARYHWSVSSSWVLLLSRLPLQKNVNIHKHGLFHRLKAWVHGKGWEHNCICVWNSRPQWPQQVNGFKAAPAFGLWNFILDNKYRCTVKKLWLHIIYSK